MKRRNMPRQKPSESKQDYATPTEFMAAARKKLGIVAFAFDFAANKRNAKADRFWSARDNSLKMPIATWLAVTMRVGHGSKGWGWLNPPFSKIYPWAERCHALQKAGGRVAFLVPASVGSNWFVEFVAKRAHVLFLHGRLCFDGKGPYPKDCILVLFDGQREFKPGYHVWDWRDEITVEVKRAS